MPLKPHPFVDGQAVKSVPKMFLGLLIVNDSSAVVASSGVTLKLMLLILIPDSINNEAESSTPPAPSETVLTYNFTSAPSCDFSMTLASKRLAKLVWSSVKYTVIVPVPEA